MNRTHKKLVFLRCDASTKIGIGHVMRCISLADGLIKQGFKCVFLTSTETIKIIPELSRFDVQHEDYINHNVGYFIIDHYGKGIEYEADVQQNADKIIVIDDLVNRKYRCDLIINQNYGASAVSYNNKVSGNCRILTGVKYAMLRQEFSQKRPQIIETRDGSINRIIISMGGTNVRRATQKIIQSIGKFTRKKLVLDIIIGEQSQGAHEVESLLHGLTMHTWNLYHNPPNISNLMVKADLAIGACGSTTWERCCLGLPQILLGLADNQTEVLDRLVQDKLIYSLGHIDDWNEKRMINALNNFIDCPETVQEYSKRSLALCDGLGVDRVVQAIKEL